MKTATFLAIALVVMSCGNAPEIICTPMDNTRQLTYDPVNGLWHGADFWLTDTSGDTVVFPGPDLQVMNTEQRAHLDLNSLIYTSQWGEPPVMEWGYLRELLIIFDEYYTEEDSLFSEKVPIWRAIIEKIGPEGNDPQLYARCCIDTLGNPCDVLPPFQVCDNCVAVCDL